MSYVTIISDLLSNQGSGAGDGWHGTHAISVHSTNTRLTDVEVIEARCPLLVEEFSIRKDSGGSGKWRGGKDVPSESDTSHLILIYLNCKETAVRVRSRQEFR